MRSGFFLRLCAAALLVSLVLSQASFLNTVYVKQWRAPMPAGCTWCDVDTCMADVVFSQYNQFGRIPVKGTIPATVPSRVIAQYLGGDDFMTPNYVVSRTTPKKYLNAYLEGSSTQYAGTFGGQSNAIGAYVSLGFEGDGASATYPQFMMANDAMSGSEDGFQLISCPVAGTSGVSTTLTPASPFGLVAGQPATVSFTLPAAVPVTLTLLVVCAWGLAEPAVQSQTVTCAGTSTNCEGQTLTVQLCDRQSFNNPCWISNGFTYPCMSNSFTIWRSDGALPSSVYPSYSGVPQVYVSSSSSTSSIIAGSPYDFSITTSGSVPPFSVVFVGTCADDSNAVVSTASTSPVTCADTTCGGAVFTFACAQSGKLTVTGTTTPSGSENVVVNKFSVTVLPAPTTATPPTTTAAPTTAAPPTTTAAPTTAAPPTTTAAPTTTTAPVAHCPAAPASGTRTISVIRNGPDRDGIASRPSNAYGVQLSDKPSSSSLRIALTTNCGSVSPSYIECSGKSRTCNGASFVVTFCATPGTQTVTLTPSGDSTFYTPACIEFQVATSDGHGHGHGDDDGHGNGKDKDKKK